MASVNLDTRLGDIQLRSPLIAASGTVGSVWEWADVADVSFYGAAVAKSVSGEPWAGHSAPRVAPVKTGMLNAIGIQNPGVENWKAEMIPRIAGSGVPIWGSAVGETPDEYATVAKGEEAAGVAAIEVNLSCPNLDEGRIVALDPKLSAEAVRAVVESVAVPVGAKLSPAAEDITAIAGAVVDAGAGFLTLTNTIPGLGIDIRARSSSLAAGSGGYSGPGLKPIAIRCVHQVAKSMPGVPIIGCGGIGTGADVVEYLMAGASAVALGTIHFSEPKAGRRIYRETGKLLSRLGYSKLSEAVGAAS